MAETYLGDGLYATRDSYGTITLRAPRGDGDHYVVLEPQILAAFQIWLAAELKELGDRVDSIGRCSLCGYEGPGPKHDCKARP